MQETATQEKFGWWRRIALWQKILAGLALGVLAGALLGETASVFKPLGDIFINAIMMLIVPLVFSNEVAPDSVVSGLLRLSLKFRSDVKD